MINRYVFHREKKGTSFLPERLKNALSYDRIAGYFDSSLLEFAGEAFEEVNGPIRIICNSDLNPQDILTAQRAEQAQKISFFKHDAEHLAAEGKARLKRLYHLLQKRDLQVRVLPNEAFGLVHGKAGVIRYEGGRRTSFLGSANETFSGWNLNYELVWEDDSPEACDWVQQRFDELWQDSRAVPLSDTVIKEVERLLDRRELDIEQWKKKPNPAGLLVESPVYRTQFGLWPHQRYFVASFWKAHTEIGARYILADQVGLGKTIQLGMAAQLMALSSEKPVLVLLPKTLMQQWQTELMDLMEVPSAVWNGKCWVDENGVEYPAMGTKPLTQCPRKIGLVSQGLIIQGSNASEQLLSLEWEGVIVDEAHRARRRKLPSQDKIGEPIRNPKAEGNKLYAFLSEISSRTRSMLFGTATPVQMHPIEAWDLLRLLSYGSDHVLGGTGSNWRKPQEALPYLLGDAVPPRSETDRWEWLRNPFPPSWEDNAFRQARLQLHLKDTQAYVSGEYTNYHNLPVAAKVPISLAASQLFTRYHPFLRSIIKRTRDYLEATIDPKTNQPYLQKINIKLYDEAIPLQSYLYTAYKQAEDFCKALAARVKSAGFFKTLLLRRIGSSLEAGINTVRVLLNNWSDSIVLEEEDDYFDFMDDIPGTESTELKTLTSEEKVLLQQCLQNLEMGRSQIDADPKLDTIIEYLNYYDFAKKGCILFSQYYDTAWYIGERIVEHYPDQYIGLYAGSGKSGIWIEGQFHKREREEIKARVKDHSIRLIVGTDAAAEGLNLQSLGTLINIDLPWNPTRLEQRKGRIQRIGQHLETIEILNLRYKDSVEDKVHERLSGRLQAIHALFGQIPEVLQNVWIKAAIEDLEEAQKYIEDFQNKAKNPFQGRYEQMDGVPQDWDTWKEVVNKHEKIQELRKGWK
ncbi:hypothetical protein B4O97_13935 [Marispirochaeta aestuarii]|uniref:Helicase SNF2 n=1 Tax=Marispirochaeta aestuarii TaxID=1963862 RepID=A0A1Y1RVI5_9SPIO|nr:phospholipase D-like domain-containing anti-phage protein [Marispirochaeta aestuarii]ORC33984.1 hypothetical protein B4O97_13935 [Marispirochaeta aestuarii]